MCWISVTCTKREIFVWHVSSYVLWDGGWRGGIHCFISMIYLEVLLMGFPGLLHGAGVSC